MQLRLADSADAPGIVEVHLRSSGAAYAALPPAVMAVSAETRRRQWIDVFEGAGSRVWVTVDGDAIAGFCHLRLLPMGIHPVAVAEIASLYIDPAYWRQGLGRRLVGAARGAAAAAGYVRLTLQVYEANTRARVAYEALGFTAEPGTIVHARSGLPLMICGMPL